MTLTIRVRPSLTYRQNLLSTLKTTERHSTFQSTLSRHQSTRAWRCRGVSGGLTRGTHDLNPAASRRFPMLLDDTVGATCALIFFPWILFGRPPLLAQCVDPDVRLYYAAVQNLVYGCRNVPQKLLKSSTHHGYIVPNMWSNT